MLNYYNDYCNHYDNEYIILSMNYYIEYRVRIVKVNSFDDNLSLVMKWAGSTHNTFPSNGLMVVKRC